MIINDCNLPQPIYDAMCNHGYTGTNAGDYSVSQLGEDPRIVHGKKLLKEKELDSLASDQLIMFLGTLIHDGLESKLRDNPNYQTEERLQCTFVINGNTIILTGEYDIFNKIQSCLSDYKTTVSGGWKMKDEKLVKYNKQVQTYKYLRYANSKPVAKKMSIIFIITDWREQETVSSGYPPCMFMEVDVPDISKEEIENYIIDRLTYFEQWKDKPINEMPYCSPENRWHQQDIWKVIKLNQDGTIPSKVRAVTGGNCETEDDAIALVNEKGSGYSILKIDGDDKRCRKYCEVAKAGLCNYLTKKDNNGKQDNCNRE